MTTLRAGRMRRRRYGLPAAAAVARLVVLAGTVVAAILVLGIVLTVLGANRHNEIVAAVHDAARWLAGPFDSMFKLSGHRLEVAVNWGIAAVVYSGLARLLARIVLR